MSIDDPSLQIRALMRMEEMIVIPTAKSVQKTLHRNSQKSEEANNSQKEVSAKSEVDHSQKATEEVTVKNSEKSEEVTAVAEGGAGFGCGLPVKRLSQEEVNETIAKWKNDLSRQSRMISTLEVSFSILRLSFVNASLTKKSLRELVRGNAQCSAIVIPFSRSHTCILV